MYAAAERHKTGGKGFPAVVSGSAGEQPDGADEEKMGQRHGQEQHHGRAHAGKLCQGVHEPEVERRLVRVGQAVHGEHEPVAALEIHEGVGQTHFVGEPQVANLPHFQKGHGRGENQQHGQPGIGERLKHLGRRAGSRRLGRGRVRHADVIFFRFFGGSVEKNRRVVRIRVLVVRVALIAFSSGSDVSSDSGPLSAFCAEGPSVPFCSGAALGRFAFFGRLRFFASSSGPGVG